MDHAGGDPYEVDLGGVRAFVPRFVISRFVDLASRVRHSDTLAGHRTLAATTARDLVAIAWPRS
jgi:hypothetical protein